MTTIVTTATASDFLALVPRLVGFVPRNSLVLVAFRGTRTCGAMRFDLPDDSASRVHKRIATTLVGMVSKLPGVDAVVPVVYTDDGFAGSGIPRAEFVEAVVARLRFSGFLVRDALCVAADGWGSYIDSGCPAAGRALADIASSPVLDDVRLADARPLGEVAEGASLPSVSLDARERVARALDEFRAVLGGGGAGERRGSCGGAPADEPAADEPACDRSAGYTAGSTARPAPDSTAGPVPDPTPEQIRSVLDDIPAMLEEILSSHSQARPGVVDPLAAAFVIAISQSPAIRDVVMLQWAFDLDLGDRVLDDAESFARGAPAGALETAGLMLGRGPRPDPVRVEVGIGLLKSIAALAPDTSRAPLYCMLAWLNWALGRSSVAGLFVAAAQEVDRHYGLADLLRTMLDRAILPEWAFEPNGTPG